MLGTPDDCSACGAQQAGRQVSLFLALCAPLGPASFGHRGPPRADTRGREKIRLTRWARNANKVAMPRRRWIRSSLDESRWWVAIILAAIAVARTPISKALTIVTWCAAIAWLAVCLFWDFFRWHWPFLPVKIERHI